MNIVAIGGFPRSGTRQFADIMNAHSSCIIQGEIANQSLRAMTDLVVKTDEKLQGGRRTEKAYVARRLRFVLETYRMVSKSSSEPLVWDFSKQNLGFKKPFAEHFYEDIHALFSPSVQQVKMFICLRNIEKNFLSLSGAFGYTPKKFKAGIVKTDKALGAIKKNPFFEVFPLFLDEFICKRADEKGYWLVDNIFSKLDLDLSPSEAAKMYEKTKNANRTPSEKRRLKITDAERAEIFEDKVFMKHVASIEAVMGVTLR